MTWRDSAIWQAHLALPGMPLFPVPPGTKQSYLSERATGTKWGHTSDPAELQAMARRFPHASAGLPTGVAGLLVVDVDPRNRGDDTMRDLEERHGPLPVTWRVTTPSGGWHAWFKATGAAWERSWAHALGAGLDSRGLGGMVVVPPSLGKDGSYRWIAGRGPADVPLAPLPSWISAALRARHERRRGQPCAGPIPSLPLDRRVRAARAYLSKVPGAVEGSGGDHATFVAAALCRDFGLEEREALALLLAWNERCSPPWSREELEQKIRNAFSYATGTPGARLARTA